MNNFITKFGLSFLIIESYFFSFTPHGDCHYFSYQLDIYSLLLSIVLIFFIFFIFSFLFKNINCNNYFNLLCIIFFLFNFYLILYFNYLIPAEFLIKYKFLFFIFNIILIYFIYSKKLFYNIYKFFSCVGVLFAILILYRLFNLHDCYFGNNSINNIDFKGNPDRQVIWIIFDEFDPEFAFNNHYSNLTLHNFNALKNSSLINNAMYPAAVDTISSIPASIMGRKIKSEPKISSNGSLTFIDDLGVDFKFENEGSIFSRINQKGYDASIFGFYHPYCKLFKNTDCYLYSDRYSVWYEGFVRLFSKFVFNIIPDQQYIPISWTGDILNQQFNDVKLFVHNKRHNLLYIHLMLPHLPARLSQQYYKVVAKNEDEAYRLNLKLSDQLLGDILNSIPNDGRERLLILDSDHWLRSRNEGHSYPSLSLIKVLSDSKNFLNNQPTSRIYMPDLVIDFLDGKIKSNNDVLHFYSNKTYHSTYMPIQK